MKKFIKNNRLAVVTFIICAIFVIMIFAIKLTFFPDESKAKYGDRLDGIEKVEITSSQEDDLIKALNESEEVSDVSCNIEGRTLNVIITVNDEVELDSAKALSSVVIDNLKEKQVKFYDMQVFIEKNNDDVRFPIIGYKHQDKDAFSWTKDR